MLWLNMKISKISLLHAVTVIICMLTIKMELNGMGGVSCGSVGMTQAIPIELPLSPPTHSIIHQQQQQQQQQKHQLQQEHHQPDEHYQDQMLTKQWWQTAVFYHILPYSFLDTDNDGIGDLPGITKMLPYLSTELGINAIWLGSIYESLTPSHDNYIINFTTINPEYGTMNDFDNLMENAKLFNLKIILNLIPNHSSDECEWFLLSIARDPKYVDYYIWNDGRLDEYGLRQPPNNWLSQFNETAWTWNEQRQQFYFHQFSEHQPDLNYRNPLVLNELMDIMSFWLAKGVDGFHLNDVNYIFEDFYLQDEPNEMEGGDDTNNQELLSYISLKHIYTKDLIDSEELIYNWRQFMENWKLFNGGDDKILMANIDTENIKTFMKYYESDDENHQGVHLPINSLFPNKLNKNSDVRDILFEINKWFSYMPFGKTPNWMLGDQYHSRIGSKFGNNDRIDAMNILLLTLPGVAVTYYGEEIGMLNNQNIGWYETKDPKALHKNSITYQNYTNDPFRTPFQWNDEFNAGFSIASSPTWLPVHFNYPTVNLLIQKLSDRSHYKLYKRLMELRQHPTLQNGIFQPFAVNKHVLAYTRILSPQDDIFVVVINFDNQPQVMNLNEIFMDLSSENLFIAAASIYSTYEIGDVVDTNYFGLIGYDAVVLKNVAF